MLLAMTSAPPTHAAATPSPRPAPNTLGFRADRSGHVVLKVDVNGAPIHFLLDTGASLVTLTPEDARAAGISPGELHFTAFLATANGQIRVAPVKLRELRLNQLTMENVDAVVVESPLAVSLLGMSFLKRLDSYEMRDGTLFINF